MSYTALYRKLRPKNFNEVIGQKHIIKTLKNQFENLRINHAYLFCGTRGTGKTSTAKIFAKLLNCEMPIENCPCEKCEMCISFQKNTSLNVIEIDAASNNGVDDIRNIRDEIKYPPTKGKYKIYIIDEVHMLSIGAFNALLKTLEEPPSYIIFILATTDPQKIPITILSRCQRFDFKRITIKDMVNAIKENIKNENIQIDDDALEYIALIADGAMRDALSILEQCNSFYYNQNITLEDVLEILGAVDNKVFFRFTEALINFNSLECINIIDEIIINGRDINQFISDSIIHFRNIIVAGVSSDETTLNLSFEKYEMLKEQYKIKDSEYFVKLIGTFSELQNQIKYLDNGRIILEAVCIKLCNAVDEQDIFDLKEKIKLLEQKFEERSVEKIYINEEKKTEKEKVIYRKLAVREDFKPVIENWKNVIRKFKEIDNSKGSVKGYEVACMYFQESQAKTLEDDFIYIICKNGFEAKSLEEAHDAIKEILADMFEKEYNLYFITNEEFEKKYKKVSSSKPKETVEAIGYEDIADKILLDGVNTQFED